MGNKENEMIKMADTVRNRKGQTERKLEQFRNMLSGTYADYSKLVLTASGRFSAVKSKRLISDLIDCVNVGRALATETLKNFIIQDDVTKQLIDLSKPLNEEQTRFYECYFYLLLGISLYKNDHSNYFDRETVDGTWGSLMKHCGYKMHYSNSADLFRDMILLLERPSAGLVSECSMGIIYDILCVYRYITGNFITELFTEKERNEAYERMNEEQKKIYDDPSAIDPMVDEYFWGTFEVCTPEEMKNEGHKYESEQAAKDPFSLNLPSLRNYGIESWSKYFTNRKRVKDSCGVVMRGLFNKSIAVDFNFDYFGHSAVLSAIELCMAQKGYSVYLDDKKIFAAYAYLNKAYQAASERI